MSKGGKGGIKFVEKYAVSEARNIYKGDGDNIKIPGPDHPLYDKTAPVTFDPIRVEAIDRDGTMTTPIEVWTDPETGTLWVLDGRGRLLDVREVNRRRAADGREPVLPYLTPFVGDEKAAIARVREKNYHRRLPTFSGTAVDLLALRKRGHSWEECAKILHVQTDDAEQWGRRLLPLAYCIDEVQAAVDNGQIPKGAIRRFGGNALDGTEALARKEQLSLLAQMTRKSEKPQREFVRITAPVKKRVVEALASTEFKGGLRYAADAVVATIAAIDGDSKAFEKWPELEKVISAALKPQKRGPKTKSAE